MSQKKSLHPPVPWERLRPYLKTGDLVLFHGLDLERAFIEFIEHSQWPHVGMVVRPNRSLRRKKLPRRQNFFQNLLEFAGETSGQVETGRPDLPGTPFPTTATRSGRC